jgi:hypothetical protein
MQFVSQNRHSIFVGCVWLAMSASTLYFVFHFGTDVPFMDEWGCVPFMTDAKPLTFDFLWAQHNEHRMPLNKLAYILLGRWTGGELHVEMAMDVLILSALSAFLILASRRLRGRILFTDAFFPLALLDWGHWETLLMAFLFQFVASTSLVLLILAVIIRRAEPSPNSSLFVGLCLIPLTLLGTNGLIVAPPFAILVIYAAVRQWRSATCTREHCRSAGLFGIVGIALLLCIAYCHGYSRPPYHPRSPGLLATLQTSTQFLGMSLGTGDAFLWPYAAIMLLALAAVTIVSLAARWRNDPQDRTRVFGILALFFAMGTMALSIGWGRAGFGPTQGFVSRYAMLAAPMLIGIYLVWVPLQNRRARMVEIGMCIAMIFLLRYDFRESLPIARERQKLISNMRRDLESGVATSVMAERYREVLNPFPVQTAERLEMLHEARMGPYRNVRPEKPLAKR